MREKQAGCGPTGENPSALVSLEFVIEVLKAHRDLYPPVGIMMLAPSGNGVKNRRLLHLWVALRSGKIQWVRFERGLRRRRQMSVSPRAPVDFPPWPLLI